MNTTYFIYRSKMPVLSDFVKHPIKLCSQLIPGAYYGSLIGTMNKDGAWIVAPYGEKGYNGLYPLDKAAHMGRYIGCDESGDVEKFSQNGTEVHMKIKTYSFKYSAGANYISWINDVENYIKTNGTRYGIIYTDITARTCFVEMEAPKDEANIVIRGPLLVGHRYETVIGRCSGVWPQDIYYAMSPATYLGKYSGSITYGGGDGAQTFYLFEGDDGSSVRHPLNYEGTVCFRECVAL